MDIISEAGPRTEDELREIMKDCPARFRRLGSEILEISRAGDPEGENLNGED